MEIILNGKETRTMSKILEKAINKNIFCLIDDNDIIENRLYKIAICETSYCIFEFK